MQLLDTTRWRMIRENYELNMMIKKRKRWQSWRQQLMRAGAGMMLLCLTLTVAAQQFSVRGFRMLPNDISAYIDPVKDLNEEACALIKVVGDISFAFSTPLGIVQRRNEVGEVWIYVPRATRLLTLKHPRWGVVRDYRLPLRLESRMTYELTLNLPTEPSKMVIPWLSTKLPPFYRPSTFPCQLPEGKPMRGHRYSEPLTTLLVAQLGMGGDYPTVGIRAVVMRRWGGYLMAQSDFHSVTSTSQSCDKQGVLIGSGTTPYYTGEVESRRWMATVGGIRRMVDRWCLYGGAGYGSYLIAWQRAEGEMVKNEAYSAEGVAAELGLLYRGRRWVFSAGTNTIAMKRWEATLGVGIRF